MRVRNPPPLPEFKTVYTVILYINIIEELIMEEEIWKTVVYNGEVYDTIEVSNIGRMRNSKNGRIYKLSLNKTGYYQKNYIFRQ